MVWCQTVMKHENMVEYNTFINTEHREWHAYYTSNEITILKQNKLYRTKR